MDYEQALDQALGSGMNHYVEKNSWNPVFFDDCFGIYTKPHSSGLNIYMAEIVIKRSAHDIQDYLWNIYNYQEWLTQYKNSELLSEMSDSCKVFYLCTKHIKHIRGRELVLASKKSDMDRYKTVIFTSVEHDARHVFYKVRGWVYFFTFIIEQVGSEESNVAWLCHYDPKGVKVKKFYAKTTVDFLKNLQNLKSVLERDSSRISPV
ncbi:unnamed protein product [Blepharisma stoltei]|uniref:START domain-containing protein n=1 Tax=Blepharisma stoltei TaxID=1481888 RepID=A0AAU9IWU2_9CILI|nr:unnamed protein product [Blepharisma stoltei]